MIPDGIEMFEWAIKAIETIKDGVADKLQKGNITIYKCGKIIRIDIKED